MTGKMIYVTKGGPCPVAPEVVVDVKFLRGSNWGPAGCWDWDSGNRYTQVQAYRVVPPEEVQRRQAERQAKWQRAAAMGERDADQA
ncbi:hypothetical protein [Bordetella genomosp. 11]|uniref:hypothetical protein n=1 Tax=Bordetella genomosp. 11 TaxID=1416808 RepID=UPI0011408B34|nr:hypothetical protein [Bordetella genomosp. 11]